MTKKATAIDSLLSGDVSGRLKRLHDKLISIGLRTRMPSNSSTLLFEVKSSQGERIGLAALRDVGGGVFSFPRTYWERRIGEVDAAMSGIDRSHFIATEGAFSSSQYSARQVSVSAATIAPLEQTVSGVIAQHARVIAGVA